MENGSTPSPGPGAVEEGAPEQNGHLPLSARLLGAGVRGARTVSKAAGIDRAVEAATEEAIVAAVESEAVERAMARVLQGPVVEEAVQNALGSEAVKRAALEAMDSELVDEVWRRLLASEEAQQLVERIAEAPEVRAAISAQGVGLMGDVGRTIARLARHLDDTLERVVRRIFLRPRRPVPTDHAGLISRGLAYLVDGVFVNLGFTVLLAAVTLVDDAFGGTGDGPSSFAVAAGSAVWLAAGALYLFAFWSLAGQTPGMRFLGVRLSERPRPGAALRRVVGFGLSVVTFGVGFLGVVFGERRLGWEDRLSGLDVVYDERRPEPAPWSEPVPPGRGAGAAGDEPVSSAAGAAEPATDSEAIAG